MHALTKLISINRAEKRVLQPHYWHPRIAALRRSVNSMPVGDDYRQRLRSALYQYADQFITRPFYRPEQGWDDLEELQQVTLADWTEESLRRMALTDNPGKEYPQSHP